MVVCIYIFLFRLACLNVHVFAVFPRFEVALFEPGIPVTL